MQKSIGIVLYNFYPEKNRIILLDREKGKISCIMQGKNICLGSVISYVCEKRQRGTFLCDVEVIEVPCELAQQDILFLHHTLEICFYFIPFDGGKSQVFDLILFLYAHISVASERARKKLFLCKLFTMLGICPEYKTAEKIYFYLAELSSVDMITHEAIDLKNERTLERWLLQSLLEHPRMQKFKTIHFLTKNRAP